jgi:type I restriction enzyme M protein
MARRAPPGATALSQAARGADSERSWTVTRKEIDAKGYDLKAVNRDARSQEDRRTPEELLNVIEAKGREVAEAVTALRALAGRDDP